MLNLANKNNIKTVSGKIERCTLASRI
jgi:hypothetical protein